MRLGLFLFALLLLALPALAGGSGDEPVGTIEFIESWPQHTELDLPDLRDASEVWPLVLGSARESIDLAGFYFSRKGDGDDSYGPDSAPDLFRPVLGAVSASAARGVAVRTVADAKFNKTYPDVPVWLGDLPGAETRILDLSAAYGGGVLHAKYFLVDDGTFYVGSQNFDWRALGQIHELGVLVNHTGLATDARRVYEMDWQAAAGETAEANDQAARSLAELSKHSVTLASGTQVEALIAASPQSYLPEGLAWDLPLMVEMIDSAADSVHVQLLSYGLTDREKRLFDDLDRALRRAAVRGAKVRIILSNWAKSRYAVPWIKSLAAVPGIEIRFTNIPEHPDGFIPFARVEHAKFLTVDGNACWIGTSNWSRDYFHTSRNIGVILLGAGAPRDPDRFFNLSWHGPYAETVSPCGEYKGPRRN
jgi:phosphatidylserine/phosphatidylglycerophosphate/cardiolipin synthase-like enzyme